MKTFAVKIKNVQLKSGWLPHVTRHAILRYLDRVWDIPEDKLLAPMQTDSVRRAIVFGAGKIKLENCHLVIDQGRIVTVLGKNMRPHRKSAKQSKRAERLMLEAEE